MNTAVDDRIKDVKTALRSACKRAGLTGVTFCTLRHACGSWLGNRSGVRVPSGAPLSQGVMAHSKNASSH